MSYILIITFLAVCAIIVYQDLKDREVTAFLFIILILIAVIVGVLNNPIVEYLSGTGINVFFLLLLVISLTIIFSLKEKRIVLITDKWLGAGDLLFLFVAALSFAPLNFLVFYLVTVFMALVFGIALWKKNEMTIPLAGVQAFCMIVLLIYSILSGRPGQFLYDQSVIINLLM